MTARTCIRRSELYAQIGPRNSKTMIPPRIDIHISRLRHVALDALCPGRTHRMPMMILPVVLARRMLMTRRANLISCVLEPRAMRIVAIAALDVLVKHLAFQE